MSNNTVSKNIELIDNVQRIDVKLINKNNWNANYVPRKIMEKIVDDIKQNGFIGSIIVQKHNTELKKDFVIINGEHRFEALTKIFGMESVPCTVIDCNDTTARILSIRLNREHGELAPDKLSLVLKDLQQENDMVLEDLAKLTAFEEQELRLYLSLDIDDALVNTENDDELAFSLSVPVEEVREKKRNEKMGAGGNNAVVEGTESVSEQHQQQEERDPKYHYVGWTEFFHFIRKLATDIKKRERQNGMVFDCVYAVPTGGIVGAYLLSKMLNVPMTLDYNFTGSVGNNGNLVVYDEIFDTGTTYTELKTKLESLNRFRSLLFVFATARGTKDDGQIHQDILDGVTPVGKMIVTDKYVVFPYDVYGLDSEPLKDRAL